LPGSCQGVVMEHTEDEHAQCAELDMVMRLCDDSCHCRKKECTIEGRQASEQLTTNISRDQEE
jgi:hypothetical protein